MRYTLVVRILEARDLSRTSPFLPDEEDYELCLNALHEDLSQISGISKVSRSASSFVIETTRSTGLEEMKELLKPALSTSVAEKLRFVSLGKE